MQSATAGQRETLRTLPGDDVRQVLWRFAGRYDLQMLVHSVRAVARGPVARLVASGARDTHEWTPEKQEMLAAFDTAGITSLSVDAEYGGFLSGPKNFALALAAFELAWVDGGAATASLAGALGLAPIHERGTEEQKAIYMSGSVPGPDVQVKRGAFCLTEPLPYAGVETGLLSGKARVAEWPEGGEPVLEISKRGRFITNMGFANFVTAAVDSDDERIKGSFVVILEESDPGVFDRGTPTKKLVHQLSSTCDPVFQLRVPANRIIGGYTVNGGVLTPNYSHGEVIEAVFKRTRVTVGLMTAAKLLSAVEPVIRYQRERFRGGETVAPGSPRFEMGLQQKEDALHRLLDVWATGEAAASLGFATARLFDELDPLEREKDRLLADQGIQRVGAEFKALRKRTPQVVQLIREGREAEASPLDRYLILDAQANVLCPATKLWNTGHGANLMREAVSLMGGYGITEDCPGFLPQKWMDAQLEATYEGPEAVQRRQLSVTMTNEVFLALWRKWIREMREIAGSKPGSGACTLATAMQMWLWTLEHLLSHTDADGTRLYSSTRHGVTFALADALCWLLASRFQILDVLELEAQGGNHGIAAEGLDGTVNFLADLCHIQAARAGGEAGRIAAELVHGYNRHPAWDSPGYAGCYHADELVAIESLVPGICAGVLDVVEDDGSHPHKAGPCVPARGLESFQRMRTKLDGCLTGSMLAKDRAAAALQKVMIPAALDYPA